MTTAARPTFEPARGGQGRGENDLSALSVQYSSRDLPSHTKLKYRYFHSIDLSFLCFRVCLNNGDLSFFFFLFRRREPGQGTTEELQKQDFAKTLEEKEKNVTAKAIGGEPPV